MQSGLLRTIYVLTTTSGQHAANEWSWFTLHTCANACMYIWTPIYTYGRIWHMYAHRDMYITGLSFFCPQRPWTPPWTPLYTRTTKHSTHIHAASSLSLLASATIIVQSFAKLDAQLDSRRLRVQRRIEGCRLTDPLALGQARFSGLNHRVMPPFP